MLQQFLDPAVLASISSLDLVREDGGGRLRRGPAPFAEFGFSQEFAEYQQYVQGDDLRHIDWNVFARTERLYLKRFKGETNMQLLILLDASASMTYGSGKVRKLDYARYVAASLAYLSSQQRDATGLIVFDQDVSELHSAVHPAGPADAYPARHRKGGRRLAHRFLQALHPLPAIPEAARHCAS